MVDGWLQRKLGIYIRTTVHSPLKILARQVDYPNCIVSTRNIEYMRDVLFIWRGDTNPEITFSGH